MHISIIDDEKILTTKISKKLQLHGYSVSEFFSYKEFMQNWYFDNISDLYIVDLSLWDGSWFDIIKSLRNNKKISTPIIIMTWFWDIQNKLFWFDVWADDYITKPFLPEELLARVRAILRRPNQITDKKVIVYKDLVLKYPSKDLYLKWKKIDLNRKETYIVELFLNNIWKLIKKEELIKTVWWSQSFVDVTDNTLYATLSKLKRKLWNSFPLYNKPHVWFTLE